MFSDAAGASGNSHHPTDVQSSFDINGRGPRYHDSDEGSDEDARRNIHLMSNIHSLLKEKNWYRRFDADAIEDEYIVFSVGGKLVLSVFSMVIAVGFLMVAVVVGYFSHAWLGFVHVLVTLACTVVALFNYWFCVKNCTKRNEVACAKLHENLGIIFMTVCLVLPLLQHEYDAICLNRKRHYPTKERDCTGNIFPHTTLLIMAFSVLMRYRPIVSTGPIIAFPLILFLGRFINPVGSTSAFAFNISLHIVVCVLSCMFSFTLDLQHRQKFADLITLKHTQHVARGARTQLDATLESILPKSVLSRLASGEPVMDVSSNATISVCEIFDFVQWSTHLLPSSIFQAVNALYSAFDETAVRMKLEKLKAMGDLYVCSVGVQEPAFPEDAAKIIQFGLKQLSLVKRLAQIIDSNAPPQLRIGIHTGPAVGVMVGNNSLSYEVFGRTLDVAKLIAGVSAEASMLVSERSLEYGVGERFENAYFTTLNPVEDPMSVSAVGTVLPSSCATPTHPNGTRTTGRSTPRSGTSDSPLPNVGTGATPVMPDSGATGALTNPLQLFCVTSAIQGGAGPPSFSQGSFNHPNANNSITSIEGSTSPLRRHSSMNSARGRIVSTRYKILLDHIKNARRQSDTMSLLNSGAASESILGRDEAADIEANFEKVSTACLLSTEFANEDVQLAYRQYLRKVDRDDGTPVMIFLSIFLLAVFIVVLIEIVGGLVVGQDAPPLAFFGVVVVAALVRTVYRRMVVTPHWEVIALVLITAAAFVAAGTLNLSIINGEFQYLNAVFIPLIAYNCVRQPVLVTGLAMFFGSIVPMVGTFIVAQGRVPIEMPIAAPLWFMSGIYMARDREVYHRLHFISLSLSEIHLQNAEDEMNLQRELLNMMFPKHAVQAVILQCTADNKTDTVFVQKFPAICVLNLRIDGLTPILRNLEGSNADLLRKLEEVTSVIEEALKLCTSLSRIQSIGDSYLIVGPIVPSEEKEELPSASIRTGSPTNARCSPASPASPSPQASGHSTLPVIFTRDDDIDVTTNTTTATETDRKTEREHSNGPLAPQRFKHEDELLNAALECIDFLGTLYHQLPLEFSAILNEGSAYGAVMGAERITFDVIGVATRQAMALMSAASPGFTGATLSFKRVITNLMGDPDTSTSPHSMFHRSLPSNVTFEEPQGWRVRGVGRVQISPLTWSGDRIQNFSSSGYAASQQQYSFSTSTVDQVVKSASISAAQQNSIGVAFTMVEDSPVPPIPS